MKTNKALQLNKTRIAKLNNTNSRKAVKDIDTYFPISL